MPSVIAMIVAMPASAASRIESAAKRGGTKTIAVFAPVSSTASWKVSKTGMPSTSWPPLPGVTPDDDVRAVALVVQRVERALAAGDARDAQARVAVDEDAHAAASFGELDDLLGGLVHRRRRVHVGQVGLGEDPPALLVVRAVEPHDERHRRA